MTTSTNNNSTNYVVWATSLKTRKEWEKYSGTSLDEAEKAYNKAQASNQWKGVYIEVDNGTTRYTPQQLREA